MAGQALKFFGALYDIEREAQVLDPGERRRLRQERGKPIAEDFCIWLQAQRARVPGGSATAKAVDYSLSRWHALTRYLSDGAVPCDTDVLDKRFRYAPLAVSVSGRRRRHFSREIKVEAVKLVTERGVSIAQAARDLGVHETMVRAWVKEIGKDPEHAFPGKGVLKPEQAEIERLKKESGQSVAA